MPTKIIINNNGSIRIEGELDLFDQQGKKFDLAGRSAIALCRCGHSKNKPLCDGSHKVMCFQSEVSAFALSPQKPSG